MNYLVVSPYYPANFQRFIYKLHEHGVRVLGIGQEPYEQLNDELKASLTEYYRVDYLEDADQAIRAVGYFFHKYGPIDRIESHNEYWLELDALLRQQFNVPGLKPEDLAKTKSKSLMKEYFRQAGVPVVPGYLVKCKADIDPALASIGFPLIAKPDNGVGAAATYKLMNQEDLDHFRQEWHEETPYFFEAYVSYPTVTTYDGLIDQEGQIVFETSLTYYYAPLRLVLERLDNAFYIEKEIDPTLRAYGQAIVKTFGMKERFFHIELFKTPEGDYIAIEYNNRPAGGFAVDVYNYAHSIDLYDRWAKLVTQQAIPDQTQHGQYCLAIARRDEHHYQTSHETILATYQDQLKMMARIPHAFADLLGDTLYVITTPSRQAVDDMVHMIGQRAESVH